jgi:Autotransporter beta-domain
MCHGLRHVGQLGSSGDGLFSGGVMYLLRSAGLWAATIVLVGALSGKPARAQNALCPTSIPGQAGISFQGSSCTNSVTGAYSNAALASQSLGELSQSSTQEATKATMASIAERRATEQQSCPDGFVRINGACMPPETALRFAAEPPDASAMAIPQSLLEFAPPPTKAPAKQPVIEPPHWAVWAQAYGAYERLSGQSPGLGEFSVLALNVTSTTWTGGVVGGADYTFRNVASAGDGLIVGMLLGYESSHVSLAASSISSEPTSPNGFSTMKAQLSGPTTGAYASYFNGAFSTDLAFKTEFYNLNMSFTDLLGFQSNPVFSFPPTTVPFSGAGTTQLNVYSTSGNVNYRIPTGATTWVEPTAGFEYRILDFASGANQFALADGTLLRLQGGARFGFDGAWNGVRMSMVVTGLLYDDVQVAGGVLANSPNPLILSDEGKLRAEGILALNFYHGNGVSSFAQADLVGGEGLFGFGGKAGVRVAW